MTFGPTAKPPDVVVSTATTVTPPTTGAGVPLEVEVDTSHGVHDLIDSAVITSVYTSAVA
eukprot:CAMPEP_0113864976 /NCGR_PEP_ID=MMETSP0372-20130328/17758_1 /TAXON_ID=340204 /ORGANISM="Lankesteria abbotti" /LENGTH=59 /DNA_ID=CAMNT_0000848483 /DNA_START=3 /DNA_END=179 /DNA_ORIENTATION=- /assembly_acc=CAM_ASM_000359